MKLLSINVGLPQEIDWRGEIARTSIFKAPVAGRVRVTMLNVQGDRQSDLSVHGGSDKAVYAYPSEHYAFWRAVLPGTELPLGVFGENFTTEGLLERNVHIGDRLRAGSAEFIVTQPRMPCFKLGIRFGRPDMVKRFQRSGRPGFYLAVLREGDVAPGDSIDFIARDTHGITVADTPPCTCQMRRTRTSYVEQAICPHFQKRGGSTSASDSGNRTLDRGPAKAQADLYR